MFAVDFIKLRLSRDASAGINRVRLLRCCAFAQQTFFVPVKMQAGKAGDAGAAAAGANAGVADAVFGPSALEHAIRASGSTKYALRNVFEIAII